MPELPEELAALLRERADHAPVPPAPSDELVHTVRRRQTVRAAGALVGTALAVVAVAGVAVAVAPSGERALPPAAPVTTTPAATTPPPTTPGGLVLVAPPGTGQPEYDDPCESNTEPERPKPEYEPSAEPTIPPAEEEDPGWEGDRFEVGIDPERPRFDKARYHAPVGVSCLTVHYRDGVIKRHDLDLVDPDGKVVWGGMWIDNDAGSGTTVWTGNGPIAKGRYRLVCTVHPAMTAEVEAS
jgi:hypothetical protein